jgi:hypothetical protein
VNALGIHADDADDADDVNNADNADDADDADAAHLRLSRAICLGEYHLHSYNIEQ